ncbi:AMP-binding protein [Rhodococcus sp. BP-252]|uniref:AMP-dependent synthetase/ligase domain-containing protein n=1 Tax=Rhodococcoides kyotonense TaxID=398843 RepID=A0A177YG97_9NOCA|nr:MULTISPECIES: AMP-binding protein [Rhodococcus]NIL75147.1 hypothetical protein [Rhodococcus sp. B10]MBY6412772.1 AMP-binding protein [Rhodococcus sp. BP-320]MBY6417430.1 AMP-binding protein [Rhodococcus sp. BP-321]MBY6421792.1 AMP-binding protein [Rhodococcus sp. BP-324]MBY6427531.1 AMP-binding protein [Rhodococcus sp. BP-323]
MNDPGGAPTTAVRRSLTQCLDDAPDDVVALIADGNAVDYGSLSDSAHYLAACLHRSGVDHGTRVGVLVAGAVDFAVAFCALERLGASIVLLDHSGMPDVLVDRLRRGDVERVLGHVGTEHVLDDVLVEADVTELPTIVAGDYSLTVVVDVVESRPVREIVFFEDDQGRAAVTALVAGLYAGATVARVPSIDSERRLTMHTRRSSEDEVR